MQFLTKLKTILPLNILIILVFTSIYCFIFLNFPSHSKYDIDDQVFVGTIEKIDIEEDKVIFSLRAKEKLLVKYYGDKIFNYKLGDKVQINGTLTIPNSNTNFNLFNYKKYLFSQKTNYIVNAEEISLVKQNNNNIFYFIKNYLIDRISKIPNNSYLYAFILGDTGSIKGNVTKSYQVNGVSHLFAVSGMHISFISSILFKLLKKTNKIVRYVIVISFLLFFCFLVNFTPSAMRSILFMLILFIKKKFNLSIKMIHLFLILVCLFLIYNPYYIYNMGFLYSFIISGFLIYSSDNLKSKNYLVNIFKISLISFLASFPITIYNSFEINLLSPFLNLFFVPLVSLIIFPFSFLCLLFPGLIFIYDYLIMILENLSLFFSNINIFNIVLAKPNIVIIIIYYLIIIMVLKDRKNLWILIIILSIHTNIHKFNFKTTITFFDVGQGDSLLIDLPYNEGNIIIDTGGRYNSNNYISKNITIPYLKSFGIKQIHYLIITHGDYDHMGEAINLVENFKVEKVIFNCGEFNDLEQDLIKVLDKKKIPYYSCIKELDIDDNKLYFLNNKDYGNENDNSSVIYTELNNHKFLFMGDAGIEVEDDLIKKYNLQNIDVLKVGHHGSKTSSSKSFIDEINPKYSIISVGKNNRYGHPNDSVLDNLNDSKIYRTDQDGSIMFKIKNDKLKIETCPP